MDFIKSLAWGIFSNTSTSLSPSLLPNSSHRFQSFWIWNLEQEGSNNYLTYPLFLLYPSSGKKWHVIASILCSGPLNRFKIKD